MGPWLGEFQLLVLLALFKLRGEGYAWSIQATLAAVGRIAELGAISQVLRRLEQMRLVESRFGHPVRSPGGRRKRHYRVTPRGVKAVQDSLTILSRMLPRGVVLKRLRLRERICLPSHETEVTCPIWN
ncbi:MAG: PadR family transcriptional regulator [Gemmatimonadales bacterium]